MNREFYIAIENASSGIDINIIDLTNERPSDIRMYEKLKQWLFMQEHATRRTAERNLKLCKAIKASSKKMRP